MACFGMFVRPLDTVILLVSVCVARACRSHSSPAVNHLEVHLFPYAHVVPGGSDRFRWLRSFVLGVCSEFLYPAVGLPWSVLFWLYVCSVMPYEAVCSPTTDNTPEIVAMLFVFLC